MAANSARPNNSAPHSHIFRPWRVFVTGAFCPAPEAAAAGAGVDVMDSVAVFKLGKPLLA